MTAYSPKAVGMVLKPYAFKVAKVIIRSQSHLVIASLKNHAQSQID